MSNMYLGVDPGANGGLAILTESVGKLRIATCHMPKEDENLWKWLRVYTSSQEHEQGKVSAVVEKVTGYIPPKKGTAEGERDFHRAWTMFNFGANYGRVKMALTCAGIEYTEVIPRIWQRELGMSPRGQGESKGDWKNRLKAKAQEIFPKLKITLATADAVMLAYYCWSKRS